MRFLVFLTVWFLQQTHLPATVVDTPGDVRRLGLSDGLMSRSSPTHLTTTLIRGTSLNSLLHAARRMLRRIHSALIFRFSVLISCAQVFMMYF